MSGSYALAGGHGLCAVTHTVCAGGSGLCAAAEPGMRGWLWLMRGYAPVCAGTGDEIKNGGSTRPRGTQQVTKHSISR